MFSLPSVNDLLSLCSHSADSGGRTGGACVGAGPSRRSDFQSAFGSILGLGMAMLQLIILPQSSLLRKAAGL